MFFVLEPVSDKQFSLLDYPHVALQRNTWDDFGYKTTFSAILRLSPSESVALGSIKIFSATQKSGSTLLPASPFEALGNNYCSLGTNTEYYGNLARLGVEVFSPILKALQDAAVNDEIRQQFQELEGFKVSLLRFTTAEQSLAEAGRVLAHTPVEASAGAENGFVVLDKALVSAETELPVSAKTPSDAKDGFAFTFSCQLPGRADPVIAKLDFQHRESLPNRVNVLVGYNGTGKTKMLSNLAIVAHGYGYENKEDLLNKAAGSLSSKAPRFGTVIVVSYSAFDDFVIPGRGEFEDDALAADGSIFGYSYVGLRERIVSVSDKAVTFRLRSPAETEAAFVAALRNIQTAGRVDKLITVLKPLLSDASFGRLELSQLYADAPKDQAETLFRQLSSGHKIVLKMLIELTSRMNDAKPTLVLIDEPEIHLHPPLLAALLKSIKACLAAFDGYAVIATHSPVVLQETPSRYVHVLKGEFAGGGIASPTIETFGESIGIITQNLFNLEDKTTDWHDTLRKVAKNRSKEQIEELFGKKLGFEARSYLASFEDEPET